MMSQPTPGARWLRVWVLIRLVTVGLAIGIGVWQLSRIMASSASDSNLHGKFKLIIYVWHNVLWRRGPLLAALLLGPLAVVVLPRLRGSAWKAGAVLLSAVMLAGGWSCHRIALVTTLLVLLANGLPMATVASRRLLRGLAWIPGSLFVFPAVTLALAGWARGWVRALVGFQLAFTWFVVDQALSYERYRYEVAAWPDSQLDPDIQVVEKVRAGLYFDYRDVDLVGDRIVVTGEQTHRLMSFSLDGQLLDTWRLPKKWVPPIRGSALDAESDPKTGMTWFLGGPSHVAGVRWSGDRWTDPYLSREIDIHVGIPYRYLPAVLEGSSDGVINNPILPGLFHTVSVFVPERSELLVVTIEPRKSMDYPVLVALRTPDLQEVRVLPLRTADNMLLPTPLEIQWIPPIGKLVISSDFWDTLYVADPATGIAEPFIEAPLSNGKLIWSEGQDRLFVAIPSQLSVWVIDPYKRVVERRIPTQPGVRGLAIDSENGLMLTGSVITGVVLVQRLSDGWPVDSFRTIMPFVRNMVLVPDRGEAWLSTWSAIYRFPYLRSLHDD